MFAEVWSNFEHRVRSKLRSLRRWWQAVFPISVTPSMAADDYNPVSLRHKSKRKSRGGDGTMSRRRVSVKDLGHPDHQGWLYRKKESKGFLGIKWRKYWFVLKRTALYWYTNHLAEKAEGYIDLTNFVIDVATECKKKHAFRACHPNVMMFYFAAENHEDMNLWLNKLGLAAIQYGCTDDSAVAEYYSEASDHEEAESIEIPPPPYSEQTLRGTVNMSGPPESTHQGTLPPPYSTAVPSDSLSSPVSTMTSQSSASSLTKQRQSWLDLVSQAPPPAAETAVVCSVQVHSQATPQGEVHEEAASESVAPPDSSASTRSSEDSPAAEGEEQKDALANRGNGSDEMERLYIHLKEASLSPIGDRKPSTKREFRASFVKRCKNHTVNNKLHHIRALNSTLKSKESDLQVIEQVLSNPELTSDKFRQWKEVNAILIQEICVKDDHKEAPEAVDAAASLNASLAETSL
ncbi:interactor protein for cytohesin exchange factors 1 [Nematolebias whitei]|uniref:interactor protein for cytohesin exchange factors 1 n=1 Tax=Nematolebias whitei TaxID=451745 RepID=UPI00189BBBAD|nr:interactor protein for cytohesin exchange factors 1 [Nematolebias whitei]